MQSVITAIENDVLPHQFGWTACDREEPIRDETSPFVKDLFLPLSLSSSYTRRGVIQ